MLRGVSLLIALSFVCFFSLPTAAASAHGSADTALTNYHTRITSVAPQLDGVTVTVKEGGDKLQLSNTSSRDVIILGYDKEPYLRVGPSGVFENQQSPSCATNENRFPDPATFAFPAADPMGDPVWKRLSHDTFVTWHDHRAHWASPEPPEVVRDQPNVVHQLVDRWEVIVKQDATTMTVTGDLRWIPSDPLWPWWAGTVTLLAISAFITYRYRHRLASAYVLRLLQLCCALVSSATLVHAGLLAADSVGDTRSQIRSLFVDNYLEFALVVALIILVVRMRAQLRTVDGFLCVFALGTLVGINGLGDVEAFTAPIMNAAGNPIWLRMTTALTIVAGGCGLLLAISRLRAQIPQSLAVIDEV